MRWLASSSRLSLTKIRQNVLIIAGALWQSDRTFHPFESAGDCVDTIGNRDPLYPTVGNQEASGRSSNGAGATANRGERPLSLATLKADAHTEFTGQ